MTSTDATELGSLIARLQAEVRALRAAVAELRTGHSPRFAAIYPAFEDRFRGTEADVRDRLAPYLPEVRAAVQADVAGPRVLDVGPGRGEWLGLLAEAGLPAVGVDDNAAMVEVLRSRGLDVVHADATGHLAALPPASLDVVTAFHVVEHLDLDALLGLLAAARRVLRPGGLLVAETPNPTNLVMGACNFHLDPTHRTPIPPAQLEFLTTASGFVEVRTWALHPKEDVDLAGLRLDGVSAADTATLAAALQKGLFGPQDYALLARAGTAGGAIS
jgi:SAM-dependent methyltransferase